MIYEHDLGQPFPQDAREQLRRAIEAVFASWNTPRAQVYRRAHEIPDDLGTAVNVVQMVFGNKGERSGTGVAFTRDPSTGAPGSLRRVPAQRAGRGRRRGHPHTRAARPHARTGCRTRTTQFVETARRLEEHYRDVQDLEFTVEDDRLYLLQTRTAKRTAAAALRAAVDMVGEDLISARGGRGADRPRAARPAPAPDDRPEGRGRGRRHRPQRLPGSRVREGRLHREPRRGARAGGRGRRPRALGDDARRHPRPHPRAGGADRARRDDVARRGRRARDGQAVRGGLRGADGRRAGRHGQRSPGTCCTRAT